MQSIAPYGRNYFFCKTRCTKKHAAEHNAPDRTRKKKSPTNGAPSGFSSVPVARHASERLCTHAVHTSLLEISLKHCHSRNSFTIDSTSYSTKWKIWVRKSAR